MKPKPFKPTVAGLHLWSVSLTGPDHSLKLWVTSRSRTTCEPLRKVSKLLKSDPDLHRGNSVSKLKYKGTIDA